jgi:hypothetical protein
MSVPDRVFFFTWPVVVLRLDVVAMVNRSRVGALAMALWWSRTGQERRRCLWTARLQLPPVPPRAPSSHRTSAPHPRTPRHRLSLRFWNLQNGRPFRRAPHSGILCLQSASSTVGASSICSLHHQPLGEEISCEEQVLDLGLLAIVGGSRPLISVAEVERWLETNYAITPSSVTIS